MMSKRDGLPALLLFFCLAPLYLSTAPRTVVLEDDGLFILSSWFLRIEHPPGYPLFVLLGKLATLFVPLGSVAWRVHALSGLLAAAACVVLFLIARRLGLGRPAALLAAAGLGVSATFWEQAIIADVYALHTLLFLMLLYLALPRHSGVPSTVALGMPRRLTLSALLFGLALANHWPLLLLSTPALVVLWLPALWRERRAALRATPWALVLLLLGLTPYL